MTQMWLNAGAFSCVLTQSPGVILSKFTPRSDHVMYMETTKSQELELREYGLQLTFNETLNLKGLDGTIRKGLFFLKEHGKVASTKTTICLDSNNPTYKDNMSAFALHHGTAADSE